MKKQIVKAQKEADKDLKTSAQKVNLIAGNIIVNSGKAVFNGIDGVNRELERSQEETKKQIARTHKNTSDTLSRIITNIAFNVGERTQDVSDTVGLAIIEFTYNFVSEPTKISNVQVASLSPTSVKISWKTNHPANGKVNYGRDRTYPFDVQSEKRANEHVFILTKLQSDTTYYFEVMSHNKNYVYDANREFKTATDSAKFPR